MTQLSLDLGLDPPPLVIQTICERCGAYGQVPVASSESWQAAMLWGYIALMDHRRRAHPDHPSLASRSPR